jgi:phosphoenolpyruvate-protein kinase (PTS system EI component)/YHS domain-containing protein
MYPMIGSQEDLSFIRRLLGETVRSLQARGNVHQDRFEQGIMIEVPSAAWSCGELLGQVDFASVGTNDLLQYFFAVGRDDAHVSPSYRTQDPVALQLLRRLADTAAGEGKPLSICGEIASDPQLLPVLIGLGFEDLSIDIHALAQVEEVASRLNVEDCRRLADQCLHARTARDVRAILNDSELVTRHVDVCPPRPGQVVDPICHEVIDAVDASVSITRRGKVIHFCSTRCRDEYFYRERHEQPVLTHIH